MLWFAVWTTLVLLTVLGAVLLGRSLWRKGKALLAQLEETGRVADRLQQRVDELEALAGESPAPVPTLVATGSQREAWRALLRENRERRRGRRRDRRAVALARWRQIGVPF